MRAIYAAALSAAVCLASLVPSGAQAAYVYNLTVTGNFTGSGSISLDTLSGFDSAPSDGIGVRAFSFHVGSGVGSPQDYGLDGLDSVAWSIDASTLVLTDLFVFSQLVPFGSGGTSQLTINPPDAGSLSFGCNDALGTDCRVGSGRLSAVAVPEPASIALFAAGLASLGWMCRRRKVI